jgi:ankyrin repeat protein
MSASERDGSQQNPTDESVSHLDQPDEQRIVPPKSEKLRVDKLKYSDKNFHDSISNFFKDKDLTAIDQLRVTPNFPTPYVLAQFASTAYEKKKRGETNADYEERLKLPNGWKLLTTASNTKNGYFGAAYWHPDNQHVVIAHKGTNISSIKDIWTDVQGVINNNFVSQMNSAVTFAWKTVEVLHKVTRKNHVHFQLFFTGHSLGGWLAQITTFTTEYLKKVNNNFLKSDNAQERYHPHTEVFDSPGCTEMLTKMADTFDVRHYDRDTVLQHLDITSYLSAPNLINTCNHHQGTKYRIYPDLADMSWCEKNTVLYTITTHSIVNILQVFDHETGNVKEDNEGKLKLHEVIDWPVSDRLLSNKEYKEFFKQANHLIDYRSEITVENIQAEGFLLIRYQTKVYNGSVKNVNIFSQEEKTFLEDYIQLCKVPGSLNSELLFSLMENDQAVNEAEETLKEFKIENNIIRCTNATTLQSLFPFVRRLLQLFPEMKKIKNKVYPLETERSLEKIKQSPLDFKPNVLILKGLLESAQKKVLILRVVDGDAFAGLIKVYRVLEQTPGNINVLREGHYTILTLDRLLTLNQLVDCNTLTGLTKVSYLLIISCENKEVLNDETKQILEGLFKKLKDKPLMKIILITTSKDISVALLEDMATKELGNGFVTRDEKLTWNDLTSKSQEKLLERTVDFQGSKIALKKLICSDSPVASSLPLADLLEEKHLKIAKTPVSNSTSYGYNEKCYIDRTFNHPVVIRKAILNKKENKFPDLLASTEEEFKQLGQKHREQNVHWLVEDKSGNLVWRQSRGSLKTLREYIDIQNSHVYTPSDLDNLLEKAKHRRVTLISDTAGMGKSTVLIHLSQKIKQKYPDNWVVRIDLNYHTDKLKILKNEGVDKGKAIEFLSKKLLKLTTEFDLKLFQEYSAQKENVKIVLMLDGFDEISPFYGKTVIHLMQALNQMPSFEFWITTRTHLREELEDNLQQLSYNLEKFSERNQVEFLKKFWCTKHWFTELQNEGKEEDINKLQNYAENLVYKLTQSISDRDKELTGIPLQCRMLAEAFDDGVKTFCQSGASEPELSSKLDLLDLYRRFIDSKYDTYQEEKCGLTLSSVNAIQQREDDVEDTRIVHHRLALQVVFADEEVKFLTSGCLKFSDRQLEKTKRIGILQVNYEGKHYFIHRTFAEYYVAEFVVNLLTKEFDPSPQVQHFLLEHILLENSCRVIRLFIDGLMSKSEPPKDVLKMYGNFIDELWKSRVKKPKRTTTILHQAALECNVHIACFLLDSLKEGENAETLNEILIAENKIGSTAWHLAASGGNTKVWQNLWDRAEKSLTLEDLTKNVLLAKDSLAKTILHRAAEGNDTELLEKMWMCAEEKLTTQELNNGLLLAKHLNEGTAWHLASQYGNNQVLEKLWEWGKNQLKRDDLISELMLAKDSEGQTAWHYAAEFGKIKVLEKLWVWANEEKLNLNKLLVAQNTDGETAWHLAAKRGETEVLEKLREWGKIQLTTEEFNNKIILAKNSEGQTAWHLAAEGGYNQVLEKLREWGKEQLTTVEFNNKLMLAKDSIGETAWHYAAKSGEIKTLEKIWEWAHKEKLNLSKLLIDENRFEQTALHLAAEGGHNQVIEKLWEWGKGQLTTDEFNNKLILAKDHNRQTAWHYAAESGDLKTLENIWNFAEKDKQNLNKLLLAENKNGQTAWHLAARDEKTQVLEKLVEWGKVKITKDDLSNKLMLAKDFDGDTAWHYAAKSRDSNTIVTLWELAVKEELNLNKYLLVQNKYGQTAWHFAAERGNTEVLERLREWGKEQLTTEEFKNKIMLAKDSEGQTAWHLAAKSGHTQVLEKLSDWSKDELTTEEFKKKIMLAKDSEGQTAWYYAAKSGDLNTLVNLWQWADEEKLNLNKLLLTGNEYEKTALQLAAKSSYNQVLEKIGEWDTGQITSHGFNKKIMLDKDHEVKSAWHHAANSGDLKTLLKIREWADKEKLNLKELLIAENPYKQTAWHLAAEGGYNQVLEKLREWGKGQLTTDEFNNKLMLAKDTDGETAWHYAAKSGKIKTLEYLWDWADRENLNLNKYLLGQNKYGQTAWHLATKSRHTQVLKKLREWGKKQLTTEEFSNKLMLAKDSEGQTALHYVVNCGKLKMLEDLLEWANEEKLNPSKYLLAKNKYGQTACLSAASDGQFKVLEKLREWGKKHLTADEFNNKIMLAKDTEGQTVWHYAAKWGQLKILENLWEWANKDKLMLKKVLLAENESEQTAWHLAAESGRNQVLEKLREWGKEQLTPEEFNNKIMLRKDYEGETAWHYAARSGELKTLENLWHWADKEKLNLKKYLLVQNNYGQTAWHLAAIAGYNQVLEKLREWGKEQLTTDDFINKLIFAKDYRGQTAWHYAAKSGDLKTLEYLWELADREKLNVNYLLLAQNKYGQTSWHLAARDGKNQVLEKLRDWGKKQLNTDEYINKLLLAKDYRGRTAWQYAAMCGKIMTLEELWDWAKKDNLDTKSLLLVQNKYGQSAWHLAAKGGYTQVLKRLREWGKEQLTSDEYNNELMLAKDRWGQTAWHYAAKSGDLKTLEKLWKWADKEKLNLNKYLLAQDMYGRTAWHLAAKGGNTQVLKKLREWGKEQLTSDEYNNELMLAKDCWGKTTWHYAAKSDDLKTLEKLWKWADKEKLKPNKLLLAQDMYGRTAWHLAAKCSNTEVCQNLWAWAKEILTLLELINKLLLAEDKDGNTAWHYATMSGNKKFLKKLWEWASEAEFNLKRKLLLAMRNDGKTAWHIATKCGNTGMCQILWVWAKETLTLQELLLAKDKDGNTAWHYATMSGNEKMLKKLQEWANEEKLQLK